MLETLLFTSCLLLILFMRLQKECSSHKRSPSLPFEDIFNTLSTLVFYKKGHNYQANRAFYRSFGTFAKEAFERLDTLPRHGQHTLELVFDNGISKNVLIYCSALHASDNTLLGHTGILFDTSSLTKNKELLLSQKERLEMASGIGISRVKKPFSLKHGRPL